MSRKLVLPWRIWLLIALLLIALIPAQSAPPGPALIVSVGQGKLSSGQEASIWLRIDNSAEASAPEEGLLSGLHQEKNEALAVTAEIKSLDGRIKILSGPQIAGSIATGENRSVEFEALAKEETGTGVYPMEVTLAYSTISEIKTSGDPHLPDISFKRSTSSLDLPAEVQVVGGPKIYVEGSRGSLRPGEEASVELLLANRGDVIAKGLKASTYPQPPFNCSSEPASLGDLDPGSSTSFKATLESDINATPGDYALPYRITFLADGKTREVKSAALVTLEGGSWIRHLWLPTIAILALVLIAFLGSRALNGKKRKRKRWRR